MNRKLLALLLSISSYTLAATWKPLAGHIRYDEACFLTAHNAYASAAHGYVYAQQSASIEKQLALGVRGFMLDTRVVNKTVRLCHKNSFITRLISRGKEPMALHEVLVTLRRFLEENPTEVITLFVETYVEQPPQVVDGPFIQADLSTYILTPSDCEDWPTLSWMRTHNKRLVVFNAKGQTDYCFNAWQRVVENQWGTLCPVRACKERPESRRWRHHDRTLYLLNYFPMFNLRFDGSYEKINTTGLSTFLERILKRGLTSGTNKQLLPTFLCMDHIDIGDGLEHVMRINTLKQGTLPHQYLNITNNTYK